MMVPPARLLSSIGLCAVLAGTWLLCNPPDGDLLPINQVFLILLSALFLIWVFVAVMRGQG